MQDGALLGRVDLLALKHRLALGLDPARLGEFDERAQNGSVDPLLGIVEQEIVEGDAERLDSPRIAGEILSRRARERGLALCP